jgi:hypothetical protein
MKTLQQLERDARDRRADFTTRLGEFRSRMTLPSLAEEAFSHIDPKFDHLLPAYSAVKRHPLLAAGVVAGVAWLFNTSVQSSVRIFKFGKTARRHRGRIRQPNISTSEKETNHEIK